MLIVFGQGVLMTPKARRVMFSPLEVMFSPLEVLCSPLEVLCSLGIQENKNW